MLTSLKFRGNRRLVTGKSPTWIMLWGSYGDVSGFQTIATCRNGLKNSRDKSATSLVCVGEREKIGDVRDKTLGSRRRRGQINGDVTGSSLTCRGRHGEVGIVEFGLNDFYRHEVKLRNRQADTKSKK